MLSGVNNAASNRPPQLPERRSDDGTNAFPKDAGAAADRNPVTTSAPRSNSLFYTSIKANFDAWMREYQADGAGETALTLVGNARSSYRDIARHAADEGGFENARAFVQSLGTDQLKALQQIHRLADPIDPSTLTEEGALNLLLPKTMARDIDGDGMVSEGSSKGIIFPPGNAPQAVRDAWAKTTEGMNFATKLHLEMSMFLARNTNVSGGDGMSGAADFSSWIDRAIQSATRNVGAQRADNKAFALEILNGLKLFRANLSSDPA
ncbi:hypothetical protein GCM10011390_18700 [Aureimonas endophytica]|uniref:Uncharacterized protein n=1 Tax=Aureimonas endophytica TaxID=2027858 RepID=A0A916ZIU9_9HYPH|nr:hypothetical protein [Aureimonas endophytica]GGE00168.1 hypothetical protein GCM10011390_18700 [Aureimonas endophytica]